MLKKTLLAAAAAVAVTGGALVAQPSQAQAGGDAYIEAGYKGGHGWRHRHHRRCYVTHRRVRHYGHWHWKRVRVCVPRWNHHRRWH